MKKISSVNELQKIINDMKMNLKYKNVGCKMNNRDLGDIRSAETIINFMFDRKLKGETEFIIEFYDKQYKSITKVCKIDTENYIPISQSLMNMLDQYDIYIDEDELPNGMLDEYIKSTKEILQKYRIKQDTSIKKEIHIDTFDVSDIINVSF